VLLVPGDIARDGVVNSELTSAASGAARAPESSPLSAAMRESELGSTLTQQQRDAVRTFLCIQLI